MKFSLIIPVHNAESTLNQCLTAIFASEHKDFEVIAVNDSSTDNSLAILENYPCRIISLQQNIGAAAARNRGKDSATGQIQLFIDADVAIKINTLNIIERCFEENKKLTAVTGLLSKKCPYCNFFSQYKNLYMHYIFKKCPGLIDFLYGSIMAIRKEDFLPFNENFRITDDTELGQRYKELNKEILLEAELEVEHLKKYDFKKILLNDFFVPFWWVKSFILHNGLNDILKYRRFSHCRLDQILGILLSYIILLSMLSFQVSLMKIIFGISLGAFLFIHYDFFKFIFSEKGHIYLLRSCLFTLIDLLIMGAGITAGMLYFTLQRL